MTNIASLQSGDWLWENSYSFSWLAKRFAWRCHSFFQRWFPVYQSASHSACLRLGGRLRERERERGQFKGNPVHTICADCLRSHLHRSTCQTRLPPPLRDFLRRSRLGFYLHIDHTIKFEFSCLPPVTRVLETF